MDSNNQDHMFSFGHLEMTDSYAVITCNKGVSIDFNEIKEIQSVINSTYAGKRIGLIANRLNRYSVNPIAINALFSCEILIAGAIVGFSRITETNADVEASIIEEVPIRYFDDMNLAIKWITDAVKSQP